MTDASRRLEQIALITEELAELDQQLADGDIDEEAARVLAIRYRAQIADLERTVEASEPVDGGGDEDVDPPGRRRLSGRALTGVAIVGIAIVAVAVFAVISLDARDTAGAEGVAGDVLSGGAPIDLATITDEQMEQVVASNPDVVGMRLALARRYFEAGTFDKALDHYFEVLDRESHPEALANIGWMTYLSNRPDVAVGYLEAALERDPDYLPAQWFIANVYATLGRTEEAVVFLVNIIGSDDVPSEIKDNATILLDQVTAGS
ncbi:MAG TPA: tetratricopeptide repeat protein [Acidimicrobiia bacterium]|nr:tetratricopeptide repeat protein [Acidimicrobiia bacterium]